MLCKQAQSVPHSQLLSEMHGMCGVQHCEHPRDRCLVVEQTETKDFKPSERGKCPSQCSRSCDKQTKRLECIYTGVEPQYGNEGSEVPKGDFQEPLPYDVYAFCAPDSTNLVLVGLAMSLNSKPPATKLHAAVLRQQWGSFLG